MRPENPIERQIREATERGDFDGLAGAGKPIRGLDRPFTARSWAIDWIQREGGDLRGLLPPLLALRKERAAFLGSLAQVPSETMLRELVADFNHRLLDQYRRPIEGPMVAVGILEPEETVTAWRQARAAAGPVPPAAGPASGRTPGEKRGGNWRHWRNRRRWRRR
jgi:hypothetical protein